MFNLLILRALREVLHNQERQHHQGEHIMASITDLDAAISSLEQAETTAAASITSALNDLVAKVGAAGTPVDVSAEVARIQAVADNLTSLGTTATGEDPGAPTT